ncbi:hypothetical protein EBR96_09505, partial [bacterium]|nr:hypothetical protein [bacterium]
MAVCVAFLVFWYTDIFVDNSIVKRYKYTKLIIRYELIMTNTGVVLDRIEAAYEDSQGILLYVTDFDGCWGLQQSANLAIVSAEALEVYRQLQGALSHHLVINTGRPPESLLYSLNRIHFAQDDAAEHPLFVPHAICEMGTAYVTPAHVDDEVYQSLHIRPGYEFQHFTPPAGYNGISVRADVAFNAEQRAGELALFKMTRNHLKHHHHPGFEFEPKRHTVTLHSNSGKTSEDASLKLIDTMMVLLGNPANAKIEQFGKTRILTIPLFTDPTTNHTYRDIHIKITQGHNVADAVPYGIDKASATHEIINRARNDNPGKRISVVTVGDSAVDGLMTQAALESSHVTQVIPIRVGDRPFEEQHEKYVALAIGGDGDQGRA